MKWFQENFLTNAILVSRKEAWTVKISLANVLKKYIKVMKINMSIYLQLNTVKKYN